MRNDLEQLIKEWHLHGWVWNLVVIITAVSLGLILRFLLSFFVRKKTEAADDFSLFYSLIQHLGKPLNCIIPIVVFNVFLPLLYLSAIVMRALSKAVEISLTLLFAWALIQAINVIKDYVLYRYNIKKADNLRERKIRTQLQFIRRLLVGLIVFVAASIVLLSFEAMRKIGTGLLTGVGIGGIIIGFAAQRSLGNLLAGFQIAFTQPIRIDDAVVVENEFGTIEEITLTYVVVRIWDERRMVLPINYFIEKPFQNWTRRSAQLLGTVSIYTDFSVPVVPIRDELTRLLITSPLWDKRVNALQVTNVTERTIELRALMSAENSGNLFDLRCYVRENLLKFLHEHYPEALPKDRTEIEAAHINYMNQ